VEERARVLVVEDLSSLAHVIRRLLRQLGCTCDYAQHGLEAIKLCSAVPYDLILTDLTMPVLDGFALIRLVRNCRTNGATPIIVVSGCPLDPDEFVQEHGVQGYVQKPFDIDDFLDLVARIIDLRSCETG
jgi:two-component system, sensor histidine kinase and response regulator